ncbi:mannose-P-dolichol utilization defect 1 protein homolog [Halictus rubicundus]|uniref:mannose-P-dolichol utilization defect 1 protein homolog n=1 Tax=Halictus rubicundus TaxID=77578 RepID=UPI004036B765
MYPYVVANMAQLLKKVAHIILSEKCMEEYFDEFNFLHAGCFKATLSTCLGFAIICGSLLVKVPQVVTIVKSKSAQGINFTSVLLDLFALTATVSYSFVSGFPFSSWGDGVFLAIQTVAVAVLVLHFNLDTTRAATFLAAYVAIVAVAMSGMTPTNVLRACQTMNIPIVLISKLMQAYTNYSYGSTGQLSAVTCFMLFFGSLARIFTSIQETGDTSMIVTYICSTLANAVIAFQILYYWNVDVSIKEKSKKAQ